MNVLVIAPHHDDETLGCGGSIVKHKGRGDHVTVVVVHGHGGHDNANGPQEFEAHMEGEATAACNVLGVDELVFWRRPPTTMAGYASYPMNAMMGDLIAARSIDRVYLPWPYDLHDDHRRTAAAAMVALRAGVAPGRSVRDVWFYETLSETHMSPLEPSFEPTAWIELDVFDVDRKLKAYSHYAAGGQKDPLPRGPAALGALARLRGSQIGAEAAEAFVVSRIVER